MPNRILKESIATSEDIDRMTWFQEVFYYRLITCCDDYGRMDARPSILKAKLFPLKDRLSLANVSDALQALVDIGCVKTYDCDGKPYLCLPAWEVHQRVRNSKEKYPAPSDHSRVKDESRRNSPQLAATCGLNPIQSESESKSNPKPNACARDSGGDFSGMSSEAVALNLAISEIEAAAKGIGLHTNAAQVDGINLLLADYSREWILEAIKRASDGPSQTWNYVKGILKNWREKGGIDDAKGPAVRGKAGDLGGSRDGRRAGLSDLGKTITNL